MSLSKSHVAFYTASVAAVAVAVTYLVKYLTSRGKSKSESPDITDDPSVIQAKLDTTTFSNHVSAIGKQNTNASNNQGIRSVESGRMYYENPVQNVQGKQHNFESKIAPKQAYVQSNKSFADVLRAKEFVTDYHSTRDEFHMSDRPHFRTRFETVKMPSSAKGGDYKVIENGYQDRTDSGGVGDVMVNGHSNQSDQVIDNLVDKMLYSSQSLSQARRRDIDVASTTVKERDSVRGDKSQVNGNFHHHSGPSSGGGASIKKPMVYDFEIAQDIVGVFIGKNGRTISWIERKSGATIILRKHPYKKDCQVCSLEGTEFAIDRALDAIAGRFADIDLTQINMPNVPNTAATPTPLMGATADILQMKLPDCVNVDVIVSNIQSAGHIFVQQPTHPTFNSLERLNYCTTGCYSQDDTIIPQLPRPVEVGVICACPREGVWYRGQVAAVYPDEDKADIRYLDYGGYEKVKCCHLRQIRSDFMTLPFQSVECYLASISPLDGEENFSDEASSLLYELTAMKVLQSRTVSVAPDGIPLVELFIARGNGHLESINEKLIKDGVVRRIDGAAAAAAATGGMSPQDRNTAGGGGGGDTVGGGGNRNNSGVGGGARKRQTSASNNDSSAAAAAE